MSPASTTKARSDGVRILVVAAWFGLLTGLVEGAGLLTVQRFSSSNWDMDRVGVWYQIIWISAIFDLLLFLSLGLVLTGLAWLFPRLPILRWAVRLFALLACFDWLLLPGRFSHSGAFFFALGVAVVFTRWFGRHEVAAIHFWRRTLPWVMAATALAFLSIQGGLWLQERRAIARLPAAPPGSPNVLVIVVDALRADHLSTYGYARPTSPNLDRIARQGLQFENAFSPCSWTLPSHASLLNGRYPSEHQAVSSRFADDHPTLGEVLLRRGYRTGAFSANRFYFARGRGFGRGFIHFDDYFNSLSDLVARTLYGRKFELFVLEKLGAKDAPARVRAPEVNQSLLRWIESDQDKPFFAFLNYFDVHDPYLLPEPSDHKFSKRDHSPAILNSWLRRFHPRLTPEELQAEIDAYDEGVAYVDTYIGQLLDELERRGLRQKTLVVITSDHGESFGEHDLYLHSNALYRDLIHVPLIFQWPGHIPAGIRVVQPVSNAALPTTVLDLLGARDQTSFPGTSLAQFWQAAPGQTEWGYAVAELAHLGRGRLRDNPAYRVWERTVVTPEWQYIVHEKKGEQLYSWQIDPEERNNLVDTEEGRQVAKDLAAFLKNHMAQHRSAASGSPAGAWQSCRSAGLQYPRRAEAFAQQQSLQPNTEREECPPQPVGP